MSQAQIDLSKLSTELYSVINWIFCNMSNLSLTPLKIQKLLYYSQSWTLAYTGDPLFNEDFEAWSNGPVIDKVYKVFNGVGYGMNTLIDMEEISIDDSISLNTEITSILEDIKGRYGHLSGRELSLLTHENGSPWSVIRVNNGLNDDDRSNIIIDKEIIENIFTDRMVQEFNEQIEIEVEEVTN